MSPSRPTPTPLGVRRDVLLSVALIFVLHLTFSSASDARVRSPVLLSRGPWSRVPARYRPWSRVPGRARRSSLRGSDGRGIAADVSPGRGRVRSVPGRMPTFGHSGTDHAAHSGTRRDHHVRPVVISGCAPRTPAASVSTAAPRGRWRRSGRRRRPSQRDRPSPPSPGSTRSLLVTRLLAELLGRLLTLERAQADVLADAIRQAAEHGEHVTPETLRAEVATLHGAISSLRADVFRAMLLQAGAIVGLSSPSSGCSADAPVPTGSHRPRRAFIRRRDERTA